MKKWKLASLIIIITLISGTGGYLLRQQVYRTDTDTGIEKNHFYTSRIETVENTQLPEFILEDVNGALRSSSEWHGKIIALNFWATWCEPCRHEIPAFVALQEKYGAQGVQFIGITLQTPHEIASFISEFNVNYPQLVGGSKIISLAKQLGNDIGVLPYTVITDRNGKIVFTRRGPLLKKETEELINTLL